MANTILRNVLLRRAERTFLAVAVLSGAVSMLIYGFVRARGEHRMIEFDHAPPLRAEFVVDLNSATWPEIVQLPGIGETTARQIVAEREEGGRFTSLDDLARRVHGVGPTMMAEVRPFVRLAETERTASKP